MYVRSCHSAQNPSIAFLVTWSKIHVLKMAKRPHTFFPTKLHFNFRKCPNYSSVCHNYSDNSCPRTQLSYSNLSIEASLAFPWTRLRVFVFAIPSLSGVILPQLSTAHTSLLPSSFCANVTISEMRPVLFTPSFWYFWPPSLFYYFLQSNYYLLMY